MADDPNWPRTCHWTYGKHQQQAHHPYLGSCWANRLVATAELLWLLLVHPITNHDDLQVAENPSHILMAYQMAAFQQAIFDEQRATSWYQRYCF